MIPILSGNVASATASTGYTIDNSCRFNDDDTAYLSRTQTSGDATKFTYSGWMKRCLLTDAIDFLDIYDDNSNRFGFFWSYIDCIDMYNKTGGPLTFQKITTAKFRDVSAWYHVVIAADSSLGVAEDRVKLWVNGVRITSFGTNTNISQDASFSIHTSDDTQKIGAYGVSGSDYDGYMAEVFWIDGTAYDQDDFGEFSEDSPNIWMPKDCKDDLTFGTNGFYLDFKDSADLGADVSGNSNDFTVTNLAATDQATDTPTNNFATFNPLNPEGTITYSEGNLKANNSADASYRVAHSTFAVNNGKWYAEFKADNMASSIDSNVGIISADQIVYSTSSKNTDTYIGSWSYGANGRVSKYNADAQTSQTTYTTGDIIGVALDIDNGYLYFAKNNTWQNSGDPTSGATGTGGYALANQTDLYYFVVSTINSGGEHRWLANFGSPSYANSSDAADADGYGAFEYAPPSGFFSLCSANLAEYG